MSFLQPCARPRSALGLDRGLCAIHFACVLWDRLSQTLFSTLNAFSKVVAVCRVAVWGLPKSVLQRRKPLAKQFLSLLPGSFSTQRNKLHKDGPNLDVTR